MEERQVEADELPGEDLESMLETETLSEAAQKAREEAEAQDEEFQEFIQKFFFGELSYDEWKELPRAQQVAYRERHKGQEGHVKGVPEQEWQQEARRKKAEKRRKARRRAHRSRMVNHLQN